MELLQLGLETAKLGFLGSWFEQDNPRARVLRQFVGSDRISDLDNQFRSGFNTFSPFGKQEDVPSAPETQTVPDSIDGPESNEASNPSTPNEIKLPDSDVTETGMVEVQPGVPHQPEIEKPESAFGEPPEDIVKQATIEMRRETDAFKPQHPASFHGVEPGKQRADAEVRRDQDHAAEPPRQDRTNELLDVVLG